MAQHAAKAWLARRRKSRDRAASLASLAAEELSSVRQRARLDHLIAGIGHQVGDQLEPLLAAKFASLPEHESRAALDAVVDALGELDLSDEALLAADADPELLARRVRATLVRDAGLSEQATRLYEIALDQACRYLVQVIRHLPEFQPRALAEVLGRASQQTALLEDVLARLPRTSLHAPAGAETDEEFRDEYLRYVGNTLDRLELLGLTMRHRPKLALSVAYLSLSVTDQDRRGSRFEFDRWFGADVDHVPGSLRVEAAIGNADRTLVRGEAGSGKTTLLDWLAVTAAREAFTDRLASWNGLVPLVVRLRRYADSPLPRPEQFLDHAAGWLVGLMPRGWVHRVLRAGQGLVLVDGVDEVPAGKRRLVRDWLRELVPAFPRARVVVTSRPAAADQRWLHDEGFGSVLLEQMSPADVRVFLQRWHEAARDAESLPCAPEDLPVAERRLLRQLDNRPHLRALAASPLLCAMLCALNLGRTSELPQSRMELYQAALTMLLDLRDAEREIAGMLSGTEKTVLLRDLAWRLIQAGRSELPLDRAISFVSLKLTSMPTVDSPAEVVLTHLLERSGVLREPVSGRVDFVHRTFQEYLAASEATEQEHIETLARNAHLDTWRETVVMACGHGKRSQTRDLLTAILDRADAEPRHARRLRLLAAACLETVTDVDAPVHSRIDHVIRDHLVPPRSVRETRSLASIGHRVLRYLPETLDGLSEAAAAATTRAVALTGGADAIPRLAHYARDARKDVQNEIINAWEYFDPERYAREVLADAPLDDGRISVRSLRLLPLLGSLRNLTETELWLLDRPCADLDHLRGIPHLSFLYQVCIGEIDLAPLSEHPALRHLYLRGASGYRDLALLERLPDLVALSLDGSIDLDALPAMRKVEYLDISVPHGGADLALLRRLPALHALCVQSDTPEVVDDIDVHLPDLVHLELEGAAARNLRAASRLEHLQVLTLYTEGSELLDLRPLRGMDLRLRLLRGDEYIGLDVLGPGVRIEYY
ncbi:NACHT domain-containing protein [Saccharothrix sp. S26]|nr:NACHT domain-containing protein [Saccharothrix sp. S26]MCE6993409.1 NACHT domain-containing protein [Saccharothrix sp. S26]